MSGFKKFLVTVAATVGMALILVTAAHADGFKPPKAVRGKTPPVYTVDQALPGAQVESVILDARHARTGRKRGTGWLLHYGTRRDYCTRADVTSALRMMCVAW